MFSLTGVRDFPVLPDSMTAEDVTAAWLYTMVCFDRGYRVFLDPDSCGPAFVRACWESLTC